MSNKVIISVIIPVYRRLNLAKQAIRSVLRQKNINIEEIEIIVCDDEKKSSSKAKNNKRYFKDISYKLKYFTNKHEEGPGGNRQTGLELASGKYIVFLDSDDKLMDNYLEKMSKTLSKSNANAVICFSKSIFQKNFSPIYKLRLILLTFVRDTILLYSSIFNSKNLLPGGFYLCQISHMMFKRDKIYEQTFNYDYRRGGEDWDFIVQTLKKGNIEILPSRLLLFRYNKSSSTFSSLNLTNKWNSYRLLIKRLPIKFKKDLLHKLFLGYIHVFGT